MLSSRSGTCVRTRFFFVIRRGTPEYARRSLGSLLFFLYRLLGSASLRSQPPLRGAISCLTKRPAFDSDANKGLVQVAPVRNKSEAMLGSIDFRRSARLARSTREVVSERQANFDGR